MKPSVKLNKTTVAWTERGKGDPVLLLHPLLFTGSIFDVVAGRVAQHGYRVISPDLPGHGESGSMLDSANPDAVAETLVEFITALSIERCHIVGLSFGGIVALRLAARYPELVRSLILLGATAGEERPWNRRRYRLFGTLGSLLGPGAVARLGARAMIGSSTRSGPRGAMIASAVESAIRSNPRTNFGARVRSAVERTPVSIEARRAIECPVLAIVGKEDRIRSVRETREMTAPIHGSAVVELPLSGHLPILEHPAPTLTLILRFLDAAERSDDGTPAPMPAIDETTALIR